MTADSGRVLAGTWSALGSNAVRQMAAIPVPVPIQVGARLALDADGARHLLIPTALPERGWSQFDSPLRDAVRTLVFGEHTDIYLDVRCTDAGLFEVFDELILDVLAAGAGTSDAGASIDDALQRWRAMFRAMASGGFGRERRFGLFAELQVLELCAGAVGPDVIPMWAGPLGNAHDFELPNGCLEVKAVGASSTSVKIHGFAQLEQDREVDLHLLVYLLAESQTGRTLSELIASVEKQTGKGSLTAALNRIGYSPSVPDDRLGVIDTFVVRIDSRVPALNRVTVPAHVRDGIGNVEYELSLSLLDSLQEPVATSVAVAESLT